jgi:hypothetical protein
MADPKDNPRQVAVAGLPEDLQIALGGDRMSNDQMVQLLELTGMEKTAEEIRQMTPEPEPPLPEPEPVLKRWWAKIRTLF